MPLQITVVAVLSLPLCVASQRIGPHCSGSVRDAGGNAVPRATVVLHASSPLGLADSVATLTATTDARGRFRVRVQRGLTYRAWAHWTGEGGQHVTEIVAWPASRRLTLAGARRTVRHRVRIRGLRAWQSGEAVTLAVRDATGRRARLSLDTDVCTLPILPGASCYIELRIGPRCVFERAIRLTENGGTGDVLLPRPRRSTVTVVDIASGEPIPDVEIESVGAPSTGALPRTDRRGQAQFTVADMPGCRLRARAPGYAFRSVELADAPTIRLRKGVGIRGRVRPATAHAKLLVAVDGMGAGGSAMLTSVALQPDGTWHAPGTTKPLFPRIALALSPTHLAKLLGERDTTPANSIVGLDCERARSAISDFELSPTDLETLTVRPLRITRPDGYPAQGALVRVLHPSTRHGRTHATALLSPTIRCDRRGRCTVIATSPDTTIFIVDRDHYAVGKLADLKDTLPLQPFRTVRGIVVDSDGDAVAGARVWLRGKQHFAGDPASPFITKINERRLACDADSEGAFVLRMIPCETLQYALAATGVCNGDQKWTSSEVVMLGAKERESLQIRLDQRAR